MLEKSKGVVDFKSHLRNLYVECAEVTQLLKKHEEDILKESSVRGDVLREAEGLRGEAARLKQTIEGLKSERMNIEEENRKLRSVSASTVKDAEAQIARNLEQSRSMLEDMKKREAELISKEHAFEEKKRDLEARHAKIAQLAGNQ